mmetsp:Transcript_12506/g.41102  ORF Transcript_12506/g.41102 Transcript_12506/m.41102 type:complete len:325 (-) Transcript_12506:279-1253(-)
MAVSSHCDIQRGSSASMSLCILITRHNRQKRAATGAFSTEVRSERTIFGGCSWWGACATNVSTRNDYSQSISPAGVGRGRGSASASAAAPSGRGGPSPCPGPGPCPGPYPCPGSGTCAPAGRGPLLSAEGLAGQGPTAQGAREGGRRRRSTSSPCLAAGRPTLEAGRAAGPPSGSRGSALRGASPTGASRSARRRTARRRRRRAGSHGRLRPRAALRRRRRLRQGLDALGVALTLGQLQRRAAPRLHSPPPTRSSISCPCPSVSGSSLPHHASPPIVASPSAATLHSSPPPSRAIVFFVFSFCCASLTAASLSVLGSLPRHNVL